MMLAVHHLVTRTVIDTVDTDPRRELVDAGNAE